MNTDNIMKTDVLDIIFENRNKAYGAYDLRKFYNNRLKLALGFMFAAAAIFSAFTIMPEKHPVATTRIFDYKEPVLVNIDETPKKEPVKEKMKKAETARPKAKQTTISQKQFVSKITIVDKSVKTDSIRTLLPEDQVGAKNVTTADPAPVLVTPVKTEPGTGAGNKIVAGPDKTSVMDEDAVDIMPSYPGGMEALIKFLERNLQTPTDMEPGEAVSVRMKFVVDYNGKLAGFTTVLDGGREYNNEVIRVLKKMPAWIPGKSRGENVSVYYVIPVKFTAAD